MMRAKGKIVRPAPNSSRAGIFVAAALLTAAALAAWANSFRGPFIFDDLPAIVENATIRTLALPIVTRAAPHWSACEWPAARQFFVRAQLGRRGR